MALQAGEREAAIGPSVKVRGELSGAEDLQINGHIEGSVRLTGARLIIGAQAHVKGTVTAEEIVVLGRLQGDIYTAGRAGLRASAVVEGNIFAARLSIEPGATLHGRVDPERAAQAPPTGADRTAGKGNAPDSFSKEMPVGAKAARPERAVAPTA